MILINPLSDPAEPTLLIVQSHIGDPAVPQLVIMLNPLAVLLNCLSDHAEPPSVDPAEILLADIAEIPM